jgi:K+-sensing histidine kinase KdpD
VPPGGEVGVQVRADERTATLAVWHDGAADADSPPAPSAASSAHNSAAGLEATLGSGLGLCIAKAIVTRLGGTLGHVGRRDRGTLMYVTLPRVGAPDGP